jgi:hypothetical protein
VEKYSEPICYAENPAAVYALVVYLVVSLTALILIIRQYLVLLQRVNVPDKFVSYRGVTTLIAMYSPALLVSVTSGSAMSSFGMSSIWNLSEGLKILLVVSWCLFFLVLASTMVYHVFTLRPVFANMTNGTINIMGTKILPLHLRRRPADGGTVSATGSKRADEPAEVSVERGKERTGTEHSGVVPGRATITNISRSTGKKSIISSPEALEMELLIEEESQLLRGKEDLEEGGDSWCMFLMVEHLKKYEVRSPAHTGSPALIIFNL